MEWIKLGWLCAIIPSHRFRLSAHTPFWQKTNICYAGPSLDVSYKESIEGRTFIFGDIVASHLLYNTIQHHHCQFENEAVRRIWKWHFAHLASSSRTMQAVNTNFPVETKSAHVFCIPQCNVPHQSKVQDNSQNWVFIKNVGPLFPPFSQNSLNRHAYHKCTPNQHYLR